MTTIAAVIVLPQQKVLGAGASLVIEAANEDEQKKLTTEIAKALKADVTRLSNGIYIIMTR